MEMKPSTKRSSPKCILCGKGIRVKTDLLGAYTMAYHRSCFATVPLVHKNDSVFNAGVNGIFIKPCFLGVGRAR